MKVTIEITCQEDIARARKLLDTLESEERKNRWRLGEAVAQQPSCGQKLGAEVDQGNRGSLG